MQEVKTRTNQPVSGVDKLVEQAIQADKDIISQIKMTYDEESDYTDIIFPKGVMPLSITIDTNELFLLTDKEDTIHLVDSNGQEVEGYDLGDYFFNDDLQLIILEINGDIREQTINGLSYISNNGEGRLIFNTYNLFFPQPSGTKLYRHYIVLRGTEAQVDFVVISSSPTQISLSDISNGIKFGVNCISISGELASDAFGVPWFITFNSVNDTVNAGISPTEVVSIQTGQTTVTDTVTEL